MIDIFDYNRKVRGLETQLQQERDKVKRLREALSYVLSSTDHPNFTDRHGINDKMKQTLKETE